MLLGNLNLVRGPEDVLALSTPHPGGLDLFALLCVAGHMRDAMPQELAGSVVFTNRCGAGRLLPTKSLPFGSCARLDYVLVPQHSKVSQWHVPGDLNHCSNIHNPVLATIQYSHPKGSGARRCTARDNAAHDPDRAFQYLGSLSGADLCAQMGECSKRWVQLVRELDGITGQLSQEEVDLCGLRVSSGRQWSQRLSPQYCAVFSAHWRQGP